MLHTTFCAVVLAVASVMPAAGQVHELGDVSFAIPDGWTYQQGRDFDAMSLKTDTRFWLIAVYTPTPSSGDPETDLKTAWTRIVLAGKDYQRLPGLPYYQITHTVGYPGRRAEDSSVNHATYTRMYMLEAGRSCIPVVAVSLNRQVLDAMEYIANVIIGSIRLAPLKAEPAKNSISIADLVGHWKHGAASSYDFYNRTTGRYESNASAFYGAGYDIAPGGSFTYQMSGMVNGHVARDEDTGVVELGGGFIGFKGRTHVSRYRFINMQQALDGSSVLTLLPENEEVSAMTIIRDGDQWSRAPLK
jgi:hypothetical protein